MVVVAVHGGREVKGVGCVVGGGGGVGLVVGVGGGLAGCFVDEEGGFSFFLFNVGPTLTYPTWR